jgi:HD superfamily phosphohydrolase
VVSETRNQLYLIHSLVIVNHGEHGTRTLGITPKGVKAYEAFLLARQLMNRTVYYHHNVKVLEFMMEHFLWLVIEHMDELNATCSIAPFVPPYLKRVAAAVREGVDKDTLMAEGYQDYIRLTEDAIWSLVSAAADSKVIPLIQCLAHKLLVREILPHFAINTGKRELLREALLQEGLVEDCAFHLLDLKTTMYKGNSDEGVFVVDWQGDIEEVGEYSNTISAFRDRPEAESLLIVVDTAKTAAIEKIGKNGQFIIAH